MLFDFNGSELTRFDVSTLFFCEIFGVLKASEFIRFELFLADCSGIFRELDASESMDSSLRSSEIAGHELLLTNGVLFNLLVVPVKFMSNLVLALDLRVLG